MSYAGTVYLICFESPLSHARNYIGWTASRDVDGRFEEHQAGRGARILAAARDRQIGFAVTRTWADVDRNFERKLKNRKEAPRLCPRCAEARRKGGGALAASTPSSDDCRGTNRRNP